MSTASALQRQQTIEELQDREYDLLVIGGGITGCGIALDAIARGLSVALVEMQDFAAGTSSRSTKLVHGGLRYLKQFEIKEVAELGKERAIVYENGPHVTTPVWMLLPFHKGGTFGKYSTNLGLRVYDFLAGVKRAERRYMLSTGQTIEKEPLVKTKGLLGGGMYVEYRTDDARLTIEVAKAAIERGATLLNYIKAENFLYNEQQKISGIVATDLLTNHPIEIRAKAVVNAAGPWVDDVRTIEGKQAGKHLILSKGVHIVFDESKFPLKQAVYFDTPDGRMVFAIPRQGKTYVGTTDTFYEGDARNMDIYQEDRDYIMNAIRYMFPSVKVTDADIESSWAGVRPLIHEDGKNPSEISRKDEVWISPSGLVTIAGGKLTGYRKMAETVLNTITQELEQQFGIKSSPCTTKNIPISGGHIGGSSKFYAFLYDYTRVGKKIGLSEEEAKFLTQHYGSNVEIVFNYVKEGHPILPSWLYAQLMYGIHHEMVVHPNDFMVRRTGYMFFQMAIVQQYEEAILDEMAKQLNWTAQQRTQYEEDVKKEIKRATTAL
ncbi:glycerol-3-phosphate dehydrogenase/oxidase [Lysinibacillus fusiformis]|uniref:glycerol-3-phosphate dehydrogenase/oxidase n=1 Tax=Lysinibacillus TaxID=400634 RepID=UPI0004D5BB9F|nr:MULTISPECIES: glycerol-3-phosphate dehydrogenase/oxidase [Lysinibacillus]AJK89959.1 glycerol-3-phosphate dehydrogenase [Lysinibacillus fusiformis]KAB0445215.1 glycerol-3-phosphate dehydrogenase/oxidase [Lysinibacillus fusiformis]KEK10318.1 glycerol-3-phosphate dehydrogenase [Lysinibacillus sphaericus]KGA80282.1 glycerol-3-phosphate dehydrogenase [Lysinibacillus fusiformis]KHK50336.1 glycerol-3-phosphate dehydrogenase [Lysinibacillus sp. A1]